MTQTKEAIHRLAEQVATNPRFLHPVICDDVRALLAQRDQYRAALVRACEYIDLMHAVLPTTLHKAEAMGECAAIARVLEGEESA